MARAAGDAAAAAASAVAAGRMSTSDASVTGGGAPSLSLNDLVSSTTTTTTTTSNLGSQPPRAELPKTTTQTAAAAAAAAAASGADNSGGNPAKDDGVSSNEQQLSEDLALFLANPSLRAALADGSLDLASYSGQVEEELEQLEGDCIAVYASRASEIDVIRRELCQCQQVLAALQEMLLGFQADLGGLSGEIRQLQERSRMLDVQLKNRSTAERGLRQFLERCVLAPNLVHCITTGRVNPMFQKSVHEVNQIYKDCHSHQAAAWSANYPPAETVAGKEMQEHAAKLRWLAVSRVRDYFLQQMSLLRRPQTNVRMIQVHGLLKYASLYDFLEEACPEIAAEILNVYVESMGKTLQQLFRTYQAQLQQLDATKQSASRADVIAIEDSVLRDTLTTRAKKRVDVFCLGSRAADCLPSDGDDDDGVGGGSSSSAAAAAALAARRQEPILAHVALAEHRRYPYERLFRSLLGHLVDAVTNEAVFCRQFFKRDAFTPLFHGTCSLLLEQLENYLFGCYDALCLLLMIKVVHSHRRLTHARKIHSLDSFFDSCTHLLWPRLKQVMENHHRSLVTATAAKLGGVDLHAHYVTRRFAEFCSSILLIVQQGSKIHGPSSAAAASSSSGRASRSGGAGRRDPKTSSPKRKGASTPQRQTAAAATASASSSSAAATATSSDKKKKTPPRTTMSAAGSSEDASTGSGGGGGGGNRSAGDMLLQDLSEMADAYCALLRRLADEHASSQKKRIVFMINNLDHVVCIFQERRVVAGPQFNRFVSQLMQQRELFVEEELLTGFSKMIAFVQQTEAHMAAAGTAAAAEHVNSQVVESLVLDFARNWKAHMEDINRELLSFFSNFRNGMEILKQVLTQLLLYYTRFQDVIRRVWKNKPPAFCRELVGTSVILAEIKKYALAI